MVSIEWDILLLQIITFVIALPLIWMWLLRPLVNRLKEREKFIKESVDKIENERKEIERLKEEHFKGIKELEQRSKETLSAAVSEGERVKQQMIEDAKKEGAKMVEEAKKEIELEKNKAIEDVKDKIAELSILTAEKIIKKKISKKQHLEIIKNYSKEIGKGIN